MADCAQSLELPAPGTMLQVPPSLDPSRTAHLPLDSSGKAGVKYLSNMGRVACRLGDSSPRRCARSPDPDPIHRATRFSIYISVLYSWNRYPCCALSVNSCSPHRSDKTQPREALLTGSLVLQSSSDTEYVFGIRMYRGLRTFALLDKAGGRSARHGGHPSERLIPCAGGCHPAGGLARAPARGPIGACFAGPKLTFLSSELSFLSSVYSTAPAVCRTVMPLHGCFDQP
jgi:hypothetical protein